MHTFTPAPETPKASHADAQTALQTLADSNTTLSNELSQLPGAHQELIDALSAGEATGIEQASSRLVQEIDAYWRASSVSGEPRHTLFTTHLQETLRAEAVLKSHEGALQPNAAGCLPGRPTDDAENQGRGISTSSLHIMLNDLTEIEVKGALVMTDETGRTLLALPGSGLSEFPTPQALAESVAQWLNDRTLRRALLINADQRYQDQVFAVVDDPELFIDDFAACHVRLERISSNPYHHALKRQVDKQRADVRYQCRSGIQTDPQQQVREIEAAIDMPGLFGPSAMLERREQVLIERKLATQVPHWIKIAKPEELENYTHRLKRYDQARDALASALNGATSADHYAQVSVKTRIANDLGFDIEPDRITVNTRRLLPTTGETYTVTRPLPQLALYGLHAGDRQNGSAFLSNTTVNIDGAPVTLAHAGLSPDYLAGIIDELNLRVTFGDYQKTAYAKAGNQALMRDLLGLQISEQACAAKMQGHITAEDFDIIETITTASPAQGDAVLSVQSLKINGSDTLGRILVFRKENLQGQLQRLIMFTSDAPRTQLFQGFHNETQLLHELVGWTAIPVMTDYILQQLNAADRSRVHQTLEALNQKPHPDPGFLQFASADSFDASLRTFVAELIAVAISNHEAHTPDWLLQGSELQRQTLMALEEAANEGTKHYANQAHTRVEDFESYVHRRASEKICQLLNVATGTVDPDRIIITSERETLTYTQMIRNGYDDSIGFITPTADTMAVFKGPDDVDLSTLTPELVAGSVRGKWLADDYITQIRSTLLNPDTDGYEYRRQTSTAITRLQMQAAALRSLLKGHIDSQQYQWLETAVSNVHRNDGEVRRRYPIYPLQIHIDKPFIASGVQLLDQLVIPDTQLTHVETVQGCFILLAAENRLPSLLYTPQAPDGVEFRLFSSFTESLSRAGMIDYYKDRCRIKARRGLSFFLRDMKEGNAHKPPFIPKDSIADFAQICFNRRIERKLRDVQETTTGRHDMLSRLVWNSVEIIAVALTLPFPPASFAVGVALSMHYDLKAVQALTSESPDQAYALILASVLNIAGAAGDFAVGLKGFDGVARKLAKEAKNGVLPAALRKTSDLATQNELFPVSLWDEPLLITQPNANGHLEVFRRTNASSGDVKATGQYAMKHTDATLQPLSDSSTAARAWTPDAVSADRVVNLSLQDLPRITEGHAKGISVSNGKCYIEMNGLTYQVHYDASLSCWHIVDPQNPFAFFGRQPVRLNEQDQWQLLNRSGLRAGGNDMPTGFSPLQEESAGASAISETLHAYELPEQIQPYVYVVMSDKILDPIGMGMEAYFETIYAPMRKLYTKLRNKLYRDAAAWFAEPVVLPPRPTLPTVNATTNIDGFLKDAFANSNGLVFSETSRSIASKRLLITHMQALVEQRVEVIYLPQLFTDKHVEKLAKYHAKGRNLRAGSHELKRHLKSLNEGATQNASTTFDYYHLIKQAHRHGIEVRPLNTSVSYPVDAHPVAIAAADDGAALKMSKFIGHKIIRSDIAMAPSKRWVALVDHKAATTHDQIAGIAELEGAISVRIEDLPADQATRIGRDAGNVTGKSEPCDFKIEFAEATTETAPPSIPSPSSTGVDNPLLHSVASVDSLVEGGRLTTVGYRWDDRFGWQRVASADWVADSSPTALQQSLSDPTYEVPLASRDTLHKLVYSHRRGLDEEYFFFEPELIPVREQFFALRTTLQRDARSVLSAELPPRPLMPGLDPQPNAAQFIQHVYKQTNGMVIGEFHDSIASKKFIIDNLPQLAEENVKTLYMEHFLTDLHQAHLDHFADTGQMSSQLLNDIRTLDRGHLTDPEQVYTFEKLLIKAQQHGLEVRGIDCAASYHLKGIRQETSTTRQQIMSYFASRTIRRHQAVIGEHRWIALVGNSHSNTYASTVPGLAELESGIGVRVTDVSPGTGRGIIVDAGEDVSIQMSNLNEHVKGDFLVEIEVQRLPQAIRPPQPLPLQQRLARAGMFVTEQEPGNLHYIIHRSRDNAIHRTPIQLNAAGKVYVDRPTWAAVHLHPFDDIDALVQALEEINLTRVG